MSRNWYAQRQHRSHVSASRYSKRKNYDDIIAESVERMAERLRQTRAQRSITR